ncbi:hypothetical protein PINS_up003888 [Pythium insidiosum]|nr:hypothetical protein PINS_up003888 [Pythium insidiosum]
MRTGRSSRSTSPQSRTTRLPRSGREAERSIQQQQQHQSASSSHAHHYHEEASNRKSSMDLGMDAADAWGDGDLDLDDSLSLGRPSLDEEALDVDFSAAGSSTSGFVAAPSAGTSLAVQWVRNSSLAADHAAAGSITTAMQLLHRQIGVVNFEPLKPYFLSVFAGGAASLPTQPNFPSLRAWLQRNDSSQPAVAVSFAHLVETLKEAYRAFTAAKFDDVKTLCETILYSVPFLAVDSKDEAEKVKTLVNVCREYLMGCRIRNEVAKFPLESEPKRNIELSAYFTHCELAAPAPRAHTEDRDDERVQVEQLHHGGVVLPPPARDPRGRDAAAPREASSHCHEGAAEGREGGPQRAPARLPGQQALCAVRAHVHADLSWRP